MEITSAHTGARTQKKEAQAHCRCGHHTDYIASWKLRVHTHTHTHTHTHKEIYKNKSIS